METIKKTTDFNLIYVKGKKIYTKYAIIFYKNTNKQSFGFVASKKVGNSVKRNRIKRLFREVIRNNSLFFANKTSYILVARRTCLEDFEKLNYNIIEKDILQGLKYEKNNNILNKNLSKNK